MSTIHIAGTTTRYECVPGDTLLRAGLRAGLPLSYECNVGSCGNCKLELVEGAVDVHWPEAPGLTDKDRERNRVLGCQAHPRGDCTIKPRLLDACRPIHLPRRFQAMLAAIEDITHDIREFRFRATDSPWFLPGQYALLDIPGTNGLRAYSMSNVDDGSGEWHFQIRRVPGGQGTSYLFDRLSLGESMTLDGPYGHAWLRTDAPRDLVCIAGGAGLSPALSIARGMAATSALDQRTLHFFYGGRGPRDICGESMLRELPGFGERLFYHPIISMPELDTASEWRGEVGFVHELAARSLGSALAVHEIYFAGPPAMTLAVQRMLIQHKVPLAQMHFDRFY
jgi:toluene monooxygenase electron transfer component